MKTNLISKVLVLKFLFFGIILFNVVEANAQKMESFSKKIGQLSKVDADNLKSLAYDLQPSTTVTGNQANRMARMAATSQPKGPAPKVAYVDATNLASIDQLVPSLNSLELLRIKVSSAKDLSQSVDLTALTTSTQLKYILFIFEYNPCEGGMLDDCVSRSLSLIKGLDTFRGSTLYEISIPR